MLVNKVINLKNDKMAKLCRNYTPQLKSKVIKIVKSWEGSDPLFAAIT